MAISTESISTQRVDGCRSDTTPKGTAFAYHLAVSTCTERQCHTYIYVMRRQEQTPPTMCTCLSITAPKCTSKTHTVYCSIKQACDMQPNCRTLHLLGTSRRLTHKACATYCLTEVLENTVTCQCLIKSPERMWSSQLSVQIHLPSCLQPPLQAPS